MKKYIATIVILILLLAAALFGIQIRTHTTVLVIPGGAGLQAQPAGQFELEPTLPRQRDVPRLNPKDVPFELECQLKCG
jgi:hypothetical protein